MSREIKFRAWNIALQEMEHVLMVDFVNSALYVLPERNLEGGSQEEWLLDSVHLMQYTGLKDKNGKEIYEWDIVHCSIEGDNVGNVDVIGFRDASFWLRYRHRSVSSWMEFGNELEVIGNIYETPIKEKI